MNALEGEAANLRAEKAALQSQLKDCEGRLASARDELQNALATQDAAQSHLERLQKACIQP